MIDLHSHTNESDGTFAPAELVDEALRTGVTSLGITDHDTFAGYDLALPCARAAGLELICGIELSTKLHGHSVHLLGYFLNTDGLGDLRSWIRDLQSARRDRNIRLVARLQELGVDITLAEAEARGRGMTGRPHFAQLLVEKGVVPNLREAFDQYLDESAKGYVYRKEPTFHEGVEHIRKAGGISSLAHPIRVKGDIAALTPELREMGLGAIEAYHSDHSPQDTALYLDVARRFDMHVTGGSDFHGAVKPDVSLGTGCNGNLRIPADLLDKLRNGKNGN